MDSTDHVVVDVEIARTIEEVGGWEQTQAMGISCACVWEYRTSRMRIYGPEDVEALRERLLRADRISGYNIWRFDFPVIWGLPDRGSGVDDTAFLLSLLPKTNDLLMRIWQALYLDPDGLNFSDLHKGWGLDAVTQGTLGVGKIGYGGDAPKWFQAGQWARVASYCADDTCLERDLADFIDRYGYVFNAKLNRRLEIP